MSIHIYKYIYGVKYVYIFKNMSSKVLLKSLYFILVNGFIIYSLSGNFYLLYFSMS